MTTISKTGLADHLGVTRQRVTQFVRSGLPVRPDGWLDFDEALAWLRANLTLEKSRFADRGARKLAAKGGLSTIVDNSKNKRNRPKSGLSTTVDNSKNPRKTPDYASGKARRENALADLAELKLATERGELLDAHSVRSTWLSILADIRARLLAIPARVTDLTQLDAEIRRALEELAAS